MGESMTPDPDSVSSDTAAVEAHHLMQDDGEVRVIVSCRDFHGVEEARIA